MERREHYDPEDIESLLAERSFDELLEEERAYVLRHLSGRAEYEAMRRLLTNVRMDERDQSPLQPDPDVRNNVMAAFRQQRTPQWRVWLNSIGGLFIAEAARANTTFMERAWRPALAFATIALLVVAGVKIANRGTLEVAQEQVAELHKPDKAEPVLEKAAAPEAPAQGATTSRGDASAEPALTEHWQRTAEEAKNEMQLVEAPQLGAASERSAEAAPPPVFEEDLAARAEADEETVSEKALFDSVISVAGATHIVTNSELATNMSTANISSATPASTAKQKFTVAMATTSLANSPELLALLNTGW